MVDFNKPNKKEIENISWELIQSGINELYIIRESRVNNGRIYVPENIEIPAHILNSTCLITRKKPKYGKLIKITTDYLHKQNKSRQESIEDINNALDDVDIDDLPDSDEIIEDL